MSNDCDVFISYARRTDEAFVAELGEMLRRAGIDPWIDREKIPGGTRTQPAIQAGIEGSQHAIFVIDEGWEERSWLSWEQQVAKEVQEEEATHDGGAGRRHVVLLRFPRRAHKIPAEFANLTSVTWTADDPDPEARFWEVCCALTGRGPGPVADWHEKGLAELQGRSVTPIPDRDATPPAPLHARTRRGHAPLALSCDRIPQWGVYGDRLRAPVSEALFVTGPEGEAHELLMERMRISLPRDGWTRYDVRWSPHFPARKVKFRECIAETLDCATEQLEPTLARTLAERDVLLLHQPVVGRRFRHDAVLRYYSEWLPELVAAVEPRDDDGAPRHVVKAVQCLQWPRCGPLDRWLALLLRRLGLDGSDFVRRACVAGDVRGLVREVSRSTAAGEIRFGAVAFAELERIGRDDVDRWLRANSTQLRPLLEREIGEGTVDADALDQARDRFARQVTEGAIYSEDVLNRLIDRLDDSGR